ncbi:MAG: hypothetical protein IKV16_01325 [Clostridia bacterium]|nr:hypothetical protein [Clostridia bacterium]
MCNIAGYVGERDAAPILIEMLRAEEGIDAGFYTGLATVHEGKIYYRKICGNLDKLLRETDAASLPGKIGIIHSRTKSGGPDEWSHPFVSAGRLSKEPRIAYVANGNSGIFASRDPEYARLADGLIEEGYKMDSEISLDDGIYTRLSNGNMVHMSDVMCALIAKNIDLGKAPDLAMERAYCEMPGDIVGLLLSLDTPDRIYYSKISRPMNVAFAEHGAYLATTTMAFPTDLITDAVRLPVLSAGFVTMDSFSSKRYANPPSEVVSADFTLMTKIYSEIEKALSDGNAWHLYALHKVIKPLIGDFADKTTTRTQATYVALEALYREGRIEIVKERVDGVIDGEDAPCYKFRLTR